MQAVLRVSCNKTIKKKTQHCSYSIVKKAFITIIGRDYSLKLFHQTPILQITSNIAKKCVTRRIVSAKLIHQCLFFKLFGINNVYRTKFHTL